MLNDSTLEPAALDWLQVELKGTHPEKEHSEKRLQAVLEAIHRQDAAVIPMRTRTRDFKYWWAAAMLIIIAGGTYLWLHKQPLQPNPLAIKVDIKPGTTGAMLTLANGEKVRLDSTSRDTVVTQGETKITNKNGQLAYAADNSSSAMALYNTLATSKGHQYMVALPDGTKVWLNAASSITYPTAFNGKERSVEITGEAYFEVMHNASKPFRVKVGNKIIEDVGTSFNVNAYGDEPLMKTTLVEGVVKIDNTLVRAGEQAAINHQGNIRLLKDADVESAIAWKNGKFRFNGVDIYTILRQASRWYDVEIEYRGDIKETFSGGIPRNVNASELLNILEYSNKVNFTIEGKKIIVTPNK